MSDEFDPKDLEEEEIEDDEMIGEEDGDFHPKKGKKDLEEEDESLDDLADEEDFGDEPYDDQDDY